MLTVVTKFGSEEEMRSRFRPHFLRWPSSNSRQTARGAQRRRILAAAGAFWLTALLCGSTFIYRYSLAAGDPGRIQGTWPEHVGLERSTSGPTLVMCAHPRCACTRASVGELNLLMAALRGQVRAYVLAVKPKEFGRAWADSQTMREAARIPGVMVAVDEDGLESERFGARTSGQVMLYGADGRLLFKGGLTAFRGHMGDSAGFQRILSLVRSGKADQATSAVFGCRLSDKACPVSEGQADNDQLKGASRAKANS